MKEVQELLSNAEIDGLLELFRSEGPPIEEVADLGLDERGRNEASIVSDVDLLKPNRFSREQIRCLDRLFEKGAKSLAATLSDKLRLEMLCDCVAVEQMRFSNWLKTLVGRTVIYVLKMPPFDLPVLFTASNDLLYGAVDRILGGSGKVKSSGQDLTAAEFTVADAFVGPCLDRLCACLSDMEAFTWSIENRFSNPSMAQVLPGQDVLLSAHFQVGSSFLPGDMRFALPYAAIEPYLEKAEFGPGSIYRVPPGAMRETSSQTMRGVPLDLSVVLGEAAVPLRQLLQLAIGDVIPLSTRVGEPLVAPVQGRPKFLGHPGRQGSFAAFKVASVLES